MFGIFALAGPINRAILGDFRGTSIKSAVRQEPKGGPFLRAQFYNIFVLNSTVSGKPGFYFKDGVFKRELL